MIFYDWDAVRTVRGYYRCLVEYPLVYSSYAFQDVRTVFAKPCVVVDCIGNWVVERLHGFDLEEATMVWELYHH